MLGGGGGGGEILAQLKTFKILSSYIVIEEHESEVLQVDCRMECSLLGEQEQTHSAGTDSWLW